MPPPSLRASGGDGSPGFDTLVAAEIPGLYRYARSLVGNDADAQDLVGDTVLRALEHRDRFEDRSSVRTWLHRILHNVAVDRARRGAHEVSVGEVEELWRSEDYSVDVAAVVDRAAVAAELRDALLHLPFDYRAMVILHDVEGWTVADVARAQDIGLAAAKQRLRRGRMALVSILDREGERAVATRGLALSCWDARRQVAGYLDGTLGPDDRARLEEHLGRCATCPPLYGALVGVQRSLGSLHDPDSVIPPALVRRIRTMLQAG